MRRSERRTGVLRDKVCIRGRRALRDREAERLIRRAAHAALAALALPFGALVEVTLVDDDEIREANARFRAKDRPTDVLSFPMLHFYRGAYDGNLASERDPESGFVPLGDMLINVERAREQGEELGHGFARECAYLTVHSVLHLAGYDHEDEGEEKRAMRAREEEILRRLGLPRV
ncbi:MAG: rRNA maturation RNase YbeY [Clostridium sp. SCN 57-10]|nr:MAG: rRNA maturation RNase YbeY [Clostridium sp. SCN 57-10]